MTMRSGLVLVGLSLLVSSAWAGLLPGPDLRRQIQESDAIVVARILNGTTSVAGDRVSSDIVLRVDRVLKGVLVSGTDINATIEGRGDFVFPQTSVRPAPDLYGIWFLKSEGGKYTLLPPAPDYGELYRAVVQLPAEAPAGEQGRTPAESVRNELLSALRWLTRAHGDELRPTTQVETVGNRRVPHITFSKYGGQAAGLTDNLRKLPAEILRSAYLQLADEESPHLRSIAISGLISINDPEGPKRAAAELKALSASAHVNPIVQSLSGYHNANDPDAVRAIARLAETDLPIPLLKENASYALRVLHTKEAVPVLIALLDSDEAPVRANALAGICLFVRNAVTVTPDAVRTMSWMSSREPAPLRTAETDRFCWIGGTPEEAARLTDHVAFWKDWWQNHGATLINQQ